MKTCATCLVDKPLPSFNSDSTKPDGLRRICKSCWNIRRRGLRNGLIERPKAKPRLRLKDNPQWAKDRAARKAENKRLRWAGMTDWQKQKRKARESARKAIKKGKITRRPCEVCGDVKVEAHHDDYSKPLAVRFLCQKHHQEWHQQGTLPETNGGSMSQAG